MFQLYPHTGNLCSSTKFLTRAVTENLTLMYKLYLIKSINLVKKVMIHYMKG